MDIHTFEIDALLLLKPHRYQDERGYFMEAFRQSAFDEAVGRPVRFVQDNQSLSFKRGTVRGLHFQSPPHAQGKLVRCTRGSVIDVAVDIRRDSPTYGQHICAELSDANGCQLWVPAGFLHGFSTLEDDTVVQYKCTDYYAADCEGSVIWNDRALGIDWGLDKAQPILSDKDATAPRFSDFASPF
ncbi:MAG: dTDP-4-dehydrorhamnose 3,5-epimerase [Pseudomonadota bacterium]